MCIISHLDSENTAVLSQLTQNMIKMELNDGSVRQTFSSTNYCKIDASSALRKDLSQYKSKTGEGTDRV